MGAPTTEREIRVTEQKLAALAEERAQVFARIRSGDGGNGLEERLANLDRGIERLNEVREGLERRAKTEERVRAYARNPAALERGDSGDGSVFRAGGRVGLEAEPEPEPRPERDEALRAIERNLGHVRSEAADRLDELVRRRDPRGIGAKYLAAVADEHYRSAFGRLVMDPQFGHLRMTQAELEAVRRVAEVERERAWHERGMSLTGASGGFAVPFALDPSIILTSGGASNPIRRIARVVEIAVDEWRGVSSAGVVAAYAAEATEAADNAPTLAQPTISTEKAQAFVPFTIEIGQDWATLEEELRILFADAKDGLEAAKFITGTGTNEPFGLLVGVTNTVNAAAGADAFTLSNLYELQQALPSRYQPNAAWVGDLRILNRVRRFGETITGDASQVWSDPVSEGGPARILGKPAYEASEMPNDATTGNKFLVYGDFSRYVIVDRVGLSVELIPHLFGVNRRPSGERGLYAMWRNSAKVVDANGFRALLGTA